jgi:hypothetical protein
MTWTSTNPGQLPISAREAFLDSTTRLTRALADGFRSELLQAAKRGEEFEIESGLPDSMIKEDPEPEPQPVRTVLTVAHAYVEMRWPRAAPKSREGISDA